MKIVDSDGNLRIYDVSNPEDFKAVQVNISLILHIKKLLLVQNR